MAQTTQLIQALKQALKAHGKTYADVARHLTLSEASVKRMFSEKHISLLRLDDICQLIGLEISDLVQMLNEQSSTELMQLSLEQEKEIVSDLELLIVAVSVLNRWTMEQILHYFKLGEHKCIRHLAKLDRIKMIQLLPKNKIKLRVASNFKWREDGPIQRFFMTKLLADFFSSRFTDDDESLLVLNGMLSDSSNKVFQRRLVALAHEFEELNKMDVGLPFDELSGRTVVLALRPWNYGLFEKYRR
jgi:DNA-binding Xre family transcriptional regulator